MQKAINFLCIAIVVMSAMVSVFGQGSPSPTAFDGWDCQQASQTGYCTRQLVGGDIGWKWAGILYGDNAKWTRFVEDNPDATKVTTNGDKTILLWKAGTTVRIRRDDLVAISEIQPNMNPTVLQNQPPPPQEARTLYSLLGTFGLTLLGLGLLLLLIAATVIVVLLLKQRRDNRRELEENPLDPALMGEPMRNSVANFFNAPVSTNEARTSLHNFADSAGARLTGNGYRRHTVRARLTVPSNLTVPTQFRTGSMDSRPQNTQVFMDIFYDENSQVSDVVVSVSRCSNGLLLGGMGIQQLRSFASGSDWTNPTLIYSAPNAPAFSWEAVLAFIRGLGIQATTAEETPIVASPAGTPATVVGSETAQAPEETNQDNPTMKLTADGLSLREGTQIQIGDLGIMTVGPKVIIFGDTVRNLETGTTLSVGKGEPKQLTAGESSDSKLEKSATAAGS